jgi:LmbE family N-acetylglucosaminyl deacetylase
MKVLTITAHPDDLEIGCSGVLKKFKDIGADITSIITVKPSAEANPNRTQEIVNSELTASYEKSGFNLKILDTDLDPQTGRPNLICNNVTMTRLSELFDQADIAIIPNPEDFHQDHKATYNLAWPLLQNRAREVWTMHSWPYCYQYQSNTANLYFGIDWNAKQDLLQCYDSYLTDERIEQIRILNKMYGNKSGNEYAEAFTLKYRYVR